MQTFLPYPDLHRSVACLDDRRLGKQRVEAYQILKALRGETKGWVNHPATRMWEGQEPALRMYLRACILEWTRRGFHNTMEIPEIEELHSLPWWFGDERLHGSHRSNLLRKDADYYGQYGWTECPCDPYWWPSYNLPLEVPNV
jgi:hypothetical protein